MGGWLLCSFMYEMGMIYADGDQNIEIMVMGMLSYCCMRILPDVVTHLVHRIV